jgi:hypothetical protein
MQIKLPENDDERHWQRIIDFVFDSAAAQVWFEFKSKSAQELYTGSSEARDFHDEGQEPNHKRTKSTVHADS